MENSINQEYGYNPRSIKMFKGIAALSVGYLVLVLMTSRPLSEEPLTIFSSPILPVLLYLFIRNMMVLKLYNEHCVI